MPDSSDPQWQALVAAYQNAPQFSKQESDAQSAMQLYSGSHPSVAQVTVDAANQATQTAQASLTAPIAPPQPTSANIAAAQVSPQSILPPKDPNANVGTDPGVFAGGVDDAPSPQVVSDSFGNVVAPLSSTGQIQTSPSGDNNSFSTSEMFFAAKGTYYIVQMPTNSGHGIYAVEGLNRFTEVDAKEDAARAKQRTTQDANLNTLQSDFQSQIDPIVKPQMLEAKQKAFASPLPAGENNVDASNLA